ncbi:urease accessory protein UreH domain-containing protein [Clostridium sp. C105KSO13]|uniref:urease accessory protein UreH domain-containing protein n=1 Tax=Clostridium sp. C105KSO13 TaxID=1776045 RepID=UPI0007407E25|nr:sulfite exporter TauE/SafE family protein [Clostridium sp. C105KSO13]CUX46441.1 Heavy-metal-associated domain protein [Clostridium sp. C105KSO13]
MSIVNKELHIRGMSCVHCQNTIQRKLKHTAGIKKVIVSYSKETADITYDSEVLSWKDICGIIEKLGYTVQKNNRRTNADISKTILVLVIIVSLYMLLQKFNILNLLVPGQLADTKMGYGMLFVIGLITSVHCIAMCGGINLSQCLPQDALEGTNNSKLSTFVPALLYNLGRVISYTVIGFLLGTIGMLLGGGSSGGLPVFLQGVLKLIAGVFMVIMGINMLGIFPWLRRLNPKMPRFLAIRTGTQKGKSKRPLIVGLLNGLMPCGPLQSMQIVALAAGNPFTGALSMLIFSLGTVPLMLGLGFGVSALGKKFTGKVMNVGAVLVVVLGLAMLSQGGTLSGLTAAAGNAGTGTAGKEQGADDTDVQIVDGKQVVNSTLLPGSYPNITVQANTPVEWTIDAPNGSINGCNYKMLITEYSIEYDFQEGKNVIEFTPTEPGTYPYSCWMGMIRGNIVVTDNSET